MKKRIYAQFVLSITMILTSAYMTASYYFKLSNHEADRLSIIAFYVRIFSIFAWLIKVIHDSRVIRRRKDVLKGEMD